MLANDFSSLREKSRKELGEDGTDRKASSVGYVLIFAKQVAINLCVCVCVLHAYVCDHMATFLHRCF